MNIGSLYKLGQLTCEVIKATGTKPDMQGLSKILPAIYGSHSVYPSKPLQCLSLQMEGGNAYSLIWWSLMVQKKLFSSKYPCCWIIPIKTGKLYSNWSCLNSSTPPLSVRVLKGHPVFPSQSRRKSWKNCSYLLSKDSSLRAISFISCCWSVVYQSLSTVSSNFEIRVPFTISRCCCLATSCYGSTQDWETFGAKGCSSTQKGSRRWKNRKKRERRGNQEGKNLGQESLLWYQFIGSRTYQGLLRKKYAMEWRKQKRKKKKWNKTKWVFQGNPASLRFLMINLLTSFIFPSLFIQKRRSLQQLYNLRTE